MGLMGRYIDALPDAAKDRLIEAQSWTPYSLADGRGGGCLRGHAEGLACLPATEYYAGYVIRKPTIVPIDMPAFAKTATLSHPQQDLQALLAWVTSGIIKTKNDAAGFLRTIDRFNKGCTRWPQRLPRAIKLRAAKARQEIINAATAEPVTNA